MVTLKQTVKDTSSWAVKRIHTICESDDPLDYLNAYAVTQEFLEWLEPDMNEDVYSLAYIGEGSDYDDIQQ
tara:strand:+ start:214 stop:426 length:213 start_codon:yes stop_codon:yes gene_type:complete